MEQHTQVHHASLIGGAIRDFNLPGDAQSNRQNADRISKETGAARVQKKAMLARSMLGWHTTAADLWSYKESGRPKRTKKHNEKNVK